jgi:hypothetical protein
MSFINKAVKNHTKIYKLSPKTALNPAVSP